MIMRIIHCADIHLDSKMNTNLSKEMARERKAELLTTFCKMVDYAVENGVEAILIAGDLFDTKKVSATAGNIVSDVIRKHPHIAFFYLRGNHDEESFVNGLESVPDNLFLFSDTWRSYQLGEEKKIVVSGIELSAQNYSRIADTLSLDMEMINIVMLHGQESAYHTKDKVETIPLSALKNKGIDYLALGHVHSYKETRLDARGSYCYCGCLEGRGFDECGECGFVLLDVDESTGEVAHRFVQFAGRNLYTITVDITACDTTAQMAERLQQRTKECNYPEQSLVKYQLTGKIRVDSEKDLDYLKKQVDGLFYYVKLTDDSTYCVDYRDFEHDMSLKGEFIRTVMATEELSEQERATVIHYGLRALAGEEIIDS